MKIQTEKYYVDTILRNTKIFVQNSDNFQTYYSDLSESYFRKQFPTLKNPKYSRIINSNTEEKKEDKKKKKRIIKKKNNISN